MSNAKICDICGRIIANDNGGYTLLRTRIGIVPISKEIDLCNKCYSNMVYFCQKQVEKEQEHE